MVGLGIRDNLDVGVVFGKAAVRFIGFGDEHRPLAGMSPIERGSVGSLNGAADRIARVGEFAGAGMHEYVGEQRARGRLAMGAGDGHSVLAVHEQGENVTAMHQLGAIGHGCDDLRIVRLDRAGIHHHLRILHVLGALGELHRYAE